eukprot:1958477-Alexandrium_andersonii.AAC.1
MQTWKSGPRTKPPQTARNRRTKLPETAWGVWVSLYDPSPRPGPQGPAVGSEHPGGVGRAMRHRVLMKCGLARNWFERVRPLAQTTLFRRKACYTFAAAP